MLFDTHAHITDPDFDEDREAVVSSFTAENRFINIGYDLVSSRASVALAESRDGIWAAVGVHPHNASSYTDETERELTTLAASPRCVAIGEIGLDYHYDLSPRDIQQDVARRQLLLAERLDLPVIIHLREATEDLLKLLRETRRNYRGIIHCYTGSVETARILLDLGFHIAFGGAVTFKNANKILDAARYVPDDRLLIETDSPYMTPVPFRGKRNEPKYVALVADKLAELRGCSSEQIAELTMRNAFTLFGL